MKTQPIRLLTVLCLIAAVVMVLALCFGGRSKPPTFTPPPFEPNAQQGTPQVDDESWMPLYREGMGYSVHICGAVHIVGQQADLYLTNDAGNHVWLKLRITDEDGRILAETGLIKPGEYLQSVTFTTVPPAGTPITMKLMAYEPETYYSAGAVTLSTTIGGISK